jgi:hypothetical protein
MLKRAVIFIHRWLGVCLCGLFLLWFSSGIGMMYWPFPTVTAADRLERSPALDPSMVLLSPVEAAARAGVNAVFAMARLTTFDGRPIYRFTEEGDSERVVFADTGEMQVDVSRSLMDRVAARWTGQSAAVARVESIEQVDQWTVQSPLRTLRPLWKYSWPNGEHLYISGLSGEVVQYTTTASRMGAYLGPIPHWFYFTPLRKHQRAWSATVIYSSGIGTVTALLGLVIGAWTYSPSQRYRYADRPTSIPYQGLKRWHMVLGLVFGIAAATWAFSGMLSMDPFPPTGQDIGRSAPNVAQELRGQASPSAFAAKHPRGALAELAGQDVKELELTAFANEPMYLATLAGGRTQIVPVNGTVRAEFDRGRIIDIVKGLAAPGSAVETRLLDRYDWYYLDRHGQRPLPMILAIMNDADHTRYYIDPRTARVAASYNDRNWVSRWLYTGLHSLNFPWLYNHRPLWDIVVITFMVGGTALSVTSIVLAWQFLRRTLRL